MAQPEPPWREIITDDYMPRDFLDSEGGAASIASSDHLRELLQRQHAGEFRLRLVLRDAVDFKHFPSRDPRWFWNYDYGPTLVLSVAEIVIETRDGRRRHVDMRKTKPNAFAEPAYRT